MIFQTPLYGLSEYLKWTTNGRSWKDEGSAAGGRAVTTSVMRGLPLERIGRRAVSAVAMNGGRSAHRLTTWNSEWW